VCFFPAVIAVNRLNFGRGQVIEANSKFTWQTLLAIIAGAVFWAFVLIGIFA
jgi:hypothetical protein